MTLLVGHLFTHYGSNTFKETIVKPFKEGKQVSAKFLLLSKRLWLFDYEKIKIKFIKVFFSTNTNYYDIQ